MRKLQTTSILLCLLSLLACSNQKPVPPPTVAATKVLYQQPSDALLVPCKDPLIINPASNRIYKDNYLAYKTAYRTCRAKMQKLLQWHSDANKQAR